MFGAEPLHNLLLKDALVEFRILELDRECAELFSIQVFRQRRRDRRIESAREIRSDRHIAAEPQPRRIRQQIEQLFFEFASRHIVERF